MKNFSVKKGLVVLTLAGMITVAGAGAAFAATDVAPGAGFGIGRSQGGLVTLVADWLGLNRTEVIAERQEGKSFVQIAEENGKSADALTQYVVNERTEALDEAVASGKITEEQAALCKEVMDERIQEGLTRTAVGPRNGQGNGFGQGRGQGLGVGQGRMMRGQGMGRGMWAQNN